MADWFSNFANSPETASALAMMAGGDIREQQVAAINQARMNEENRARQGQEAFRQRMAQKKGNFTAQDAMDFMDIDPELAIRLFEQLRIQEAQQAQAQALQNLAGALGGGGESLVPLAVATGDIGQVIQTATQERALAEQKAREDRTYQRELEKEVRDPSVNAATSFGFAQRMVNASNTLNDEKYVKALTDPAAVGLSKLGNVATTSTLQEANRAKKDWMTANLRKESGAAIPESEYAAEEAKYFPQVGDSADVIKAKAQARKIAENSMKTAAGRLWTEKGGQDVIPPTKSLPYPKAAPSQGVTPDIWEKLSPEDQQDFLKEFGG